MKTFYSAQDVEALARQGQRELVIDENTVLTDLARDAAARLGLRLVTPGRTAEAKAGAVAPAPPAAPNGAAYVIAAKPRGCQHGAGKAGVNGSGPAAGKVVDDLVGAIKHLRKG